MHFSCCRKIFFTEKNFQRDANSKARKFFNLIFNETGLKMIHSRENYFILLYRNCDSGKLDIQVNQHGKVANFIENLIADEFSITRDVF